jgi:hypothetical protein
MELVACEEERGHGDRDDADQDGARHLQAVQHHDDQKAQRGQDDFGLVQVAQGHEGGRRCRDDARALERDQRQEQADAHGDRYAYGLRYALDDQLPQAEQRHQQEQAARDEDRAQRGLPGEAHVQHHHVGEIGVQAHARRQRDGIVGVQRHDGRAQRRDQAGGHEDGPLGHPRIPQDRGIDEDDVGHRQKGRQARDQLGSYIGAVLTELEHPFHPVHRIVSVLFSHAGRNGCESAQG